MQIIDKPRQELTANATGEGGLVAHPYKGILVELGDMQGVGDLTQHVTHGRTQPCPGYHDQHLILRAALVPDLHTPHCHLVQRSVAMKGLMIAMKVCPVQFSLP